jgi:prepilin-type processing-associated H-X9-DG protein
MSKISVAKPGRVNTVSPLRILMTVLIFFVVLFAFFAHITSVPRERGIRMKCHVGLKSLGLSFKLYTDDFDGSLPSVESWCDALGKYMLPENLICPGSDAKEGQSSYAMNEFLSGKKLAELPPDLVLLFESKPGWNKAGGPEILTMENHEGEGCNVLFADGYVEFIRPEKILELKWTISENNSDE